MSASQSGEPCRLTQTQWAVRARETTEQRRTAVMWMPWGRLGDSSTDFCTGSSWVIDSCRHNKGAVVEANWAKLIVYYMNICPKYLIWCAMSMTSFNSELSWYQYQTKVGSCDQFWGVWFIEGHVSSTKLISIQNLGLQLQIEFMGSMHSDTHTKYFN